jgi:outer membrane protein OmpA-like peptidoglycan-associated protein
MFNSATAVSLLVCGLLGSSAYAQTAPRNPTQTQPPTSTTAPRDDVPVFRVTVVGRTTPAVNYRHRGGATKVDFHGTALLPNARGEAKVESKQGYIEIEVEFDELKPATAFGPEFLTYVMWAITPEGRATNLGEVLLNGSESKLNVTTELQAFGLIVTAEPYFAVSQPSDAVVMENIVRDDTRGAVEFVEAKYELLQRGSYLMTSNPRELPTARIDKDTPLELYEARNAVHFARVAGADEYATDTYDKARTLLARAEENHANDRSRRATIGAAREAAQAAEDSRLIALQRREAELIARDRQRTLDREAAARASEAAANQRAERERESRARADEERLRAQNQAERAESDRQRLQSEREAIEQRLRETEQQRAALEAERIASERRRAEADAAVRAADAARVEAEQSAARLAQERQAAEARAQQLATERAAAEARAQQASDAAAQAERERAELREKLQQQLNIILDTRESARGLIVNMSDVLFDTGSANLKPGAREKLARVAGVLLTYPALEIAVEGHTDSVGGDEYNQGLSERRAASVRKYLVSQGIPQQTIDAMGFGESRPVVANTTAAGRQQNRRVELVISGESIAVPTERRERQQ